MKLDEYLAKHGISQEAFGKKLSPPVSQGLVSQWIKGDTRVTLHRALDIERVTNGEVLPEDCAKMFKHAHVPAAPDRRTGTPDRRAEHCGGGRRADDHKEVA